MKLATGDDTMICNSSPLEQALAGHALPTPTSAIPSLPAPAALPGASLFDPTRETKSEPTGISMPRSHGFVSAPMVSEPSASLSQSAPGNLAVTSQGDPALPASRDRNRIAPSEPAAGAGQSSPPALSPHLLEALLDPEVGRPPEQWRIEEANRRLEILTTFNALVEGGATREQAAKQVGQSVPTVWRWLKAQAAEGFNGLIPKTDNCGRKSWLEKLGLTADEVKFLMEQCQGIALDTESVTSALRLFAHTDQCPPRLAEVILDPTRCSKHAIPPSIRAAARVAKPVADAHRGPRRLALKGIYTPRKLDILPGDIFTADDTTPIWAWWVPWIESEEYPFGVKLLQGQFIPVMDVASQCVITFVIIAREKSSYRAADIWHLFGHTFDTIGIPRLGWQLERGSWEANLIRGQEVEYQENEVTLTRRLGGLRQLPTNITAWHRETKGADYPFPKTLETFTSYLPKSKSVEALFNRSQALEGTLWGALGRDQMRKPFEKTKQLFQRCQGSKLDPRQHFLSGIEIVTRLRQMLEYVNNEPMEGEVFHGVPRAKFDAALREHPLFCMQDDLRWLYKRDWAVVQITQGWARVRLTDPMSGQRYSLFYCHPEQFAALEGESVVVYYDRENFEAPAQIIRARTGEFLCEAQYVERVGSFLGGDQTGHDLRKRWKNAVMSLYGTLLPHVPSRQLPPEIAARRAAAAAAAAPGGEGERAPSEIVNRKSEIVNVTDGRPAAPLLPRRRNVGVSDDDFERQAEALERSERRAAARPAPTFSTDD